MSREELWQKYRVDRIKYSSLPVKEMIMSAGNFCKALWEKVEEAFKQEPKDE